MSYLTNIGSNTISITSPNAYPWSNSVNLHTLELDFDYNPNVKKFQMYEINEDLLVLSVTWKRLRDAKQSTASKLLDPILFKAITDEDRSMATEIRDYYSKKIMMWKLTGSGNLSVYRTDLNKFIHSDGLQFAENMFGLAYHLPSFYTYDNQLDSICIELTKNHVNLRKYVGKEIITLKPIKSVVNKNRKINQTEYWFRNEDNIGVRLGIDIKNPLLHIWDHLFNNSSELTIDTFLHSKDRDGFHYLKATDWKLDLA